MFSFLGSLLLTNLLSYGLFNDGSVSGSDCIASVHINGMSNFLRVYLLMHSVCLIRKIKSHTVEHHVVPSDEGYEEGKMDDKKFSTAVTHLNFINFTNARKRKQEKKVGYRFLIYFLLYNPVFKFVSVYTVFDPTNCTINNK
jgi:hypothetical protein